MSNTRSTTKKNTATPTNIENDSNSEILFYGGAALVVLAVIKAIVQALSSALIFLPLIYFYLLSTCPPLSTFHAKQELKRVFRGHHLPEQHPDKPVGFWEQTMARVTATVTTELATVTGYEVSSVSLAGGAAWWQTVRVAQREFYWVGAAQRWWYLFSREVASEKESKKIKRK